MLIEITSEDQFESLKKEYISNIERMITNLKDLQLKDIKNPAVRAELALMQSESSISFMTLCKFVFQQNLNRELAGCQAT